MTERAPEYKVGDWLRFRRMGLFVIGQVAYVRHDILGYLHYETDVGEVREDSVLEARSHESRSPDGDGLPIAKGLGDGASLTSRQDVLLPQQGDVHARHGRSVESSLKPAAGSEPADSLLLAAQPEPTQNYSEELVKAMNEERWKDATFLLIAKNDQLLRGSAPTPSAWQPIATAPKDGSWSLLTWANLVAVGYYGVRSERDVETRWQTNLGTGFPTHWMPLPAPPADADKEP